MSTHTKRAAPRRRGRALPGLAALATEGAAARDACAPTPTHPLRGLRVCGNLSTLELAPVLLAVDRVYEEPVVLQQGGITSLYGQPGDLPNLVARGVSDVATNAETQGLRYSIAHPGLRIIFTVSEGLYRIVGRRSAGIAGLSDLRGKRVGTMPRTSSAYYLDSVLRKVGLTDCDVEVVPFVAGSDVPLSKVPEALMKGEIDAATFWEPELQKAQEALGSDAIEFYDPDAYREQFCLFSTEEKLSDPFLRSRIVAFLRALVSASRTVREQPQLVWPLVAAATQQDAGIIARAWRHHTYPAALLPGLLDTLVDEEVWLAKESGRVPRGRPELAALIDPTPLQEALRHP